MIKKSICKGISRFILLICLLAGSIGISAQTPAFPTAEGYGKYATGGRGGVVVEVTNLEDDPVNPPVGSLRWAFQQGKETRTTQGISYTYNYPLTVVFRVSGIIDLNGNDLRVKRNNMTITGQTAPGDGICIKGGAVNFGGSFNLIIRHLRFRTGDYTSDGNPLNKACVILENGGNFIFDHCSFSWSSEELCNISDGGNITVQWSIFSEGLYESVNGKGARGYGPVIAGYGATYHHNLIAHTVSRSPRFGVSTLVDLHILVDFVNNVNYNFGKRAACYGGENRMGSKGSVNINMVNNYYKQGPAYPDNRSAVFVGATYWTSGQGTAYSRWHLNGNYITGTTNQHLNSDNYAGLDISEYKANVPSCTIDDIKSDRHDIKHPVATESAQDAFNSVMLKSGAFPWDSVDSRAVHEAITGTASKHGKFNDYAVSGIIDTPDDAGGWPEYKTYNTITDDDHDGMDDAWETANGLDPINPLDRNKVTKSGYTSLEVYLNSIVGENIALDYTVSTVTEDKQPEVKTYIDHTTGQLIIQHNENVTMVNIYDLYGRKIASLSGHNISSMDISELNTGIYVIEVITKNGIVKRIKIFK